MSGRVRAALSATTAAVLAGAVALSLSAVGADAAPEPARPSRAPAPAEDAIFGDLFADHHAADDGVGEGHADDEHDH